MEFFSNLSLFLFCQIRIKYYNLGIFHGASARFLQDRTKGISTEKLKQAMPLMWEEQKGITGCPFGGRRMKCTPKVGHNFWGALQ